MLRDNFEKSHTVEADPHIGQCWNKLKRITSEFKKVEEMMEKMMKDEGL